MSVPLRVTCGTWSDVPSVGRIRAIATDDHHLVLQFPASICPWQKSEIIREYSKKLPNHGDFDSGRRTITIKKVIDFDEVMANAEAIVEAAREFRRTANHLCHVLARKLRIHHPSQLIRIRSRRRGRLKAGWRYTFHGQQVRFENARAKQIVEVEIGFGDEFGVLDPFFFGLFLRTTPHLREIAVFFPDLYHDTKHALVILGRMGYLELVANEWKTGWLAR